MIGLGVGIDYALFVVTRHRQFLHEGMTVVESAARANATAGSAVVFAGITVVIAILGLQIAGLPMVTSMGIASAMTVAVLVLVAVILLPALLAIAGHRIDKLSLPGIETEDRHDEPPHTRRALGRRGLAQAVGVGGCRRARCSSFSRSRCSTCAWVRPIREANRHRRRCAARTTC